MSPARQTPVSAPSTRRQFTINAAASLIWSGLATTPGFGQGPEVPPFRSGRFQFTLLQPRQPLPSVRLFSLRGQSIDLASLAGRPLLLNFWASWCPGCRTELPMLDRLHAQGSVNVAAISIDRGGRDTVSRYVEALRVRELPIFLDPNGYVGTTERENPHRAPFAIYGMPISYLVAKSGQIIGYIPGVADWLDPAAQPILDYLRSS